MARATKVVIDGFTLHVGSDDGDEWVHARAKAVDEKIRDIRARSRTANSVELALMAAVNLAEELEHLRQDHQAMLERLERLNRRLSEAVSLDASAGH